MCCVPSCRGQGQAGRHRQNPPPRRCSTSLDAGLLGYPDPKVLQIYGEILERVRELTGVEAASLAATVPLGEPSFMDGVQRAGSPLPPPLNAATPAEGQAIGANYNVVSHDYFRTLGVTL